MQLKYRARLKKLGFILGGLAVAGLVGCVLAWIYPEPVRNVGIVVSVTLLLILIQPPKRVLSSRPLVLGLLLVAAAVTGHAAKVFDADQAEHLATLRTVNPGAYLDELKALGRDEEWYAALKDLRPDEYAAERARRDEEARAEQARKEEQARKKRIRKLTKKAAGEGRHGIDVRSADFPTIWNLSVPEGRLSCEHGPVAGGKPKPYVLFEAKGATYGVSAAAKGSGGYPAIHTLRAGEGGKVSYDIKMIDALNEAGLAMCEATLDEQCGKRSDAIAWAQIYVKSSLKAPSTAEFSHLKTRAGMTACGTWVVASHVDAQNGFGAMIRTQFRASVSKGAKDVWMLKDLQVGQ